MPKTNEIQWVFRIETEMERVIKWKDFTLNQFGACNLDTQICIREWELEKETKKESERVFVLFLFSCSEYMRFSIRLNLIVPKAKIAYRQIWHCNPHTTRAQSCEIYIHYIFFDVKLKLKPTWQWHWMGFVSMSERSLASDSPRVFFSSFYLDTQSVCRLL